MGVFEREERMREKEERNNEGRERGERRMRDIFDESRLIFEARELFYFKFFYEGLRFFLKSAALHRRRAALLGKAHPFLPTEELHFS